MSFFIYSKDMFLCDLFQAVYGGLLELHQVLTGTWILHLNLPLTLRCRGGKCKFHYYKFILGCLCLYSSSLVVKLQISHILHHTHFSFRCNSICFWKVIIELQCHFGPAEKSKMHITTLLNEGKLLFLMLRPWHFLLQLWCCTFVSRWQQSTRYHSNCSEMHSVH